MKLLLFAGTKNGRKLALSLAEKNHEVHVSSATAYGSELLAEHPRLRRHVGRLDTADITRMIHSLHIDCMIDATHPYAEVISQNLILVSQELDLPLIRYEREQAIPKSRGYHFAAMSEACKYLAEVKGNILFTTGVKDLPTVKKYLEKQRIYARVLPTTTSVEKAKHAGIIDQQIIAEKPPFSLSDNLHHIAVNDIKFLVTKDSGKEGNIEEKILAVEKAGIDLVVVDRPMLAHSCVFYDETEIIEFVSE